MLVLYSICFKIYKYKIEMFVCLCVVCPPMANETTGPKGVKFGTNGIKLPTD